MGLGITVGAWDAFDDDPGDVEDMRREIEKLNRHLQEAGLPEHHEPDRLPSGEVESYEMGYSKIHTLRHLAALLRLGLPLDRVDSDAPISPELGDYYGLSEELCQQVAQEDPQSIPGGKRMALFSSPSAEGPNFDHLVLHSDSGGFYVPIDFSPVVVAGEAGDAWHIGSSYALKRECEIIADAIGLPLELHPESMEFLDAIDSSDPKATDWTRFSIEAEVCLTLHRCASASIKDKALLLFH